MSSNLFSFQGTIKAIMYYKGGYAIMKVRDDSTGQQVSVKGTCTNPRVEMKVDVQGEQELNPKYGLTYKNSVICEVLPVDEDEMEEYLCSGSIKGIGKRFAKMIVQQFGDKTFTVLEETPEMLTQIKGIGKRKAKVIAESWKNARQLRNLVLFLMKHGLYISYAPKIYKQYQEKSIETITKNPYVLADDIWGISFETADRLALSLGFAKDCAFRVRAGIRYALKSSANNKGHLYLSEEQLLDEAVQELKLSRDVVRPHLADAVHDQFIVEEAERIYLPRLYNEEDTVARLLADKVAYEEGGDEYVNIKGIEKSLGVTYDKVQAHAIIKSINSNVMVLTGGPGTGKSTTVNGILCAMKMAGMDVKLAAPTGRAAKRLSEITGMQAVTIHRLLCYSPVDGFMKNEEDPLEADALIVDETSMVDIDLMYHLLQAVPTETHLILVGDTDQLPSVGPGSVLSDIIKSGVVPVVRLTKIFRQAESSRIITNAHLVNEGHMPDLRNGGDFYSAIFQETDRSPETLEDVNARMADYIRKLVTVFIPREFGIPSSEVQVLLPTKGSSAGVDAYNRMLQEAVNPVPFDDTNYFLQSLSTQFRLNDRVMQTVNNYEKNVFNGDIGYIVYIDTEERTVTVSFDGREVKYEDIELGELKLAYAMTVHKSQGSEYKAVVMAVSRSHGSMMLQRNLLYTGITRAKQICILAGTESAVEACVRNNRIAKRNTYLAEKIKEYAA